MPYDLHRHGEVVVPEPRELMVERSLRAEQASHPALKRLHVLLPSRLPVRPVVREVPVSPRRGFFCETGRRRIDESLDRRSNTERLEHIEFAGRKTPRCPASQEGDLFSSRVELHHTLTIGQGCEECMTKRSAVGQGSEPIECLTEIVENVLGRLDPDAEPDQIGWHLEFGPGGGRVGHHAGMLDQGLDRTERFGE